MLVRNFLSYLIFNKGNIRQDVVIHSMESNHNGRRNTIRHSTCRRNQHPQRWAAHPVLQYSQSRRLKGKNLQHDLAVVGPFASTPLPNSPLCQAHSITQPCGTLNHASRGTTRKSVESWWGSWNSHEAADLKKYIKGRLDEKRNDLSAISKSASR